MAATAKEMVVFVDVEVEFISCFLMINALCAAIVDMIYVFSVHDMFWLRFIRQSIIFHFITL